MQFKLEEFLRPNLKKCFVFFAMILVLMAVWVNIFINMLPAMVIGTQEFYDVFCDYRRLDENTALNETQKQEYKNILDATLNMLNYKYAAFSKFNADLLVGNILVPSSLYTCFLDKSTLDVIAGNSISHNFIGIDFHCNPYSIFAFFRNVVVIYTFACFVVWLVEYKPQKARKKR